MGFKLTWASETVSIHPQNENKQPFSHAQKPGLTFNDLRVLEPQAGVLLAWAIQ